MGRYLLCGREAELPYEVEDLDIRIYTIEELCYFIYHNLPVIGDDFIDERLLLFIRKELELPEITDKIERFYNSPSDQDSTLFMLLSEVGYYSDLELQDFQGRLVKRRRKNGPERVRMKAESLAERKRYRSALKNYRTLVTGERDARISPEFKGEVYEKMADCYGKLCEFPSAIQCLSKVYEINRNERVLKKIYDTCVLSGEELPEKYFSRVPDAVLSRFQQDFWNRETVHRENVTENEAMQIFLHSPEKAAEEIKAYVEKKKEEYRGMLE